MNSTSILTSYQAFRCSENAYRFLFPMEIAAKIIRDRVRIFANESRKLGMDSPVIVRTAEPIFRVCA